ncbi:MAG TPA: hypothetical protein PLY93_13220 [Turneriella sp.]|nr:hypothetical protein [Turneriella sp.]
MTWFHLWRIRRKINKAIKKLLHNLHHDSKSYLEYGNLRRGKPWGLREGREIVWIFLVDLLAERPLIYKITYHIDEGRYHCYSRSGGRNEMTNVLQFSSDSLDELIERLNMLASEVPAIRERMLRQYIYSMKNQKTSKRWMDFFKKKDNQLNADTLLHLKEAVHAMEGQHKISKGEAMKLLGYVEMLFDE